LIFTSLTPFRPETSFAPPAPIADLCLRPACIFLPADRATEARQPAIFDDRRLKIGAANLAGHWAAPLLVGSMRLTPERLQFALRCGSAFV